MSIKGRMAGGGRQRRKEGKRDQIHLLLSGRGALKMSRHKLAESLLWRQKEETGRWGSTTSSTQGVREGFSAVTEVRQRDVQGYTTLLARPVTPPGPPGHSPAVPSCFKMSLLLSFSSKHPSTRTSARRCAPGPCGMGRSAPSATWTFSSTSWW